MPVWKDFGIDIATTGMVVFQAASNARLKDEKYMSKMNEASEKALPSRAVVWSPLVP